MSEPVRGIDSSAGFRVVNGSRDDLQTRVARIEAHLSDGGGGGTYNGMNERLTALETHFGYVRNDLAELKAGQAEVHRSLSDVSTTLARVSAQMTSDKAEIRSDLGVMRSELPTKNDLWAWKLQWTAIGLAMVAIIIGGIIGGLSWIAPS